MIVKLSRRKDANKIRSEKKKLEVKNLSSLGINAPFYINDSLRIYYKKLWAKCTKLHNNGSIKVSKNDNIHVTTHVSSFGKKKRDMFFVLLNLPAIESNFSYLIVLCSGVFTTVMEKVLHIAQKHFFTNYLSIQSTSGWLLLTLLFCSKCLF